MAETGYSKGNLKPQAGSLSREFNPAHPCYFNVTDSESDYITVSFFGDVTADFEDRGLKIDGVGYPLDSASYDSETNRTTLSFLRGSFVYEDGETYEVEFGALPLPSWTVAPSISGTPQVGQTLTGNPGTVFNGTVTSRAWLRDDVAITGATGSTYTLVEADVDAMISFRPTATGHGGTASATSSAVGPIEDEGRVLIDVNGAGTGLTVQNAAEFPGATWQWYTSDGSPISGQTTSTLLFTNLPDGAAVFLRANADPSTDSTKFIEPRDTTIVAFDAADETDGALAGRFPQIPTAAAGIEFDDGKLVTTTGSEAAFIAELGTTTQRVDVELLFGNPANYLDSNSTMRQIQMGYISNTNRMIIDIRGGIISFTKGTSTGSVYNILPQVLGQNKDGDIFTIELEPGIGTELFLRVSRNGVRIDGAPGKGFDINTVGTAITAGTKVRFSGPGGTGTANPAFPIPIMTSFKGSEIVPSPVVVQTASFVAPTIEAPAQIEFSGTSATALVLEAMISAPNGETVVPFTEFTLSATGAFSGLTLPLPESMHGAPSGYILRVRDKSDIDSYSDYTIGNVPNWRPIDPNFMLGINTGAIGSSYPLIFADMTDKIRWIYGTAAGYQLNYIEGVPPPTPPLGANGNPTGYIEDEAWNYPGQNARLIMPVLIEGDGSKHSDFAQGGNVMPYGTGGAWEFKYNGTPGDFEFQGLGFAGAASPFSGFVANANGFTCNVTENGSAGNVTTWFKIKPNLAGGRGVANPNGIDISMRKVGDTTNELLLPSVKAAYGREKFIRPMHPQMESFIPLRTNYPFVGSKWADMDQTIRLAQGYGPQAIGWMCQAPLYTETSPGNDIIDPFQCVRKTFEKMAIDRAKLFANTSYTNDFIWEPGNEVFNWALPYVVYNKPFEIVADALGFFTGMAAGGTKQYAQKYAGASWFSKMAHEFFNNGTVPDLTSYGFPDLSDLANPAQALNGRVKTIIGIATGASINEIKSWFDEIGGPGGIWAIAPNSYFMTKPDNDTTLVAALDANDQPAAIARLHAMLQVTSAQTINTLKQSSLSYRSVYPNIEMITYEGRWHNDPTFSTVLRLNRYLAASNAYRKTVDYKNIEKSVIRGCIEAGFKGMADFVQYQGFADKTTDETTRPNFGIMSDAGKFIDPATAADQMAQIARLEMHDLIDSM